MFSWVLNVFNKKNKQKLQISELKIGDMIQLSYYHPFDLGFINNNQLTSTRLNPDEIENRTIKGVVVNTFKNNDILKWFIEIKVQKEYNGMSLERKFIFMEHEIETMKRLK